MCCRKTQLQVGGQSWPGACSGAAFCCQKCSPEGPSVDFPGGCAQPHVSWNGHRRLCLAKQRASCYREGFFQPLRHAVFICSWKPVLGRLFFSFPAMVALEESQEGTAALVCAALSLFPSGGGLCAELPTSQQGKPAAQWEPNSLHLFCLSLKHSFLVLTGNNLAGISNWNELFNFYIVDLSCSQAGDLPYILQIGQAKSWCFYKALLGPNLFIFLNYFSFTQVQVLMQSYIGYLVTACAGRIVPVSKRGL